jgi:predicted nucleic acid-binding protein
VQILVDSSVWIEYFTGAPSPEADYLYRLLGQQPLVVADVVLAEVLHGLPDEVHRRQAWDALIKFWMVEIGGVNLAWFAAANYHTLKARGIRVRMDECRLATYCINERFALLHSSPGYDPFEKHLGLTVARPGG